MRPQLQTGPHLPALLLQCPVQLTPCAPWLQRDDRAIENEGIDNLTEEELRSACRARGMRAPFGSGAPAFMQKQLHDWVELSLHRWGGPLPSGAAVSMGHVCVTGVQGALPSAAWQSARGLDAGCAAGLQLPLFSSCQAGPRPVPAMQPTLSSVLTKDTARHQTCDAVCRALPSSLLLMSRALTVTAVTSADQDMDQLKSTLSSLPDKVIAEASLEKLSDAAECAPCLGHSDRLRASKA